MSFEDVLYEAADGIATITINRPNVRNAVRPQTYEELTAAMGIAANDPKIGVVVLQGAGDKAFCAGGDVKDQQGRNPQIARPQLGRGQARRRSRLLQAAGGAAEARISVDRLLRQPGTRK